MKFEKLSLLFMILLLMAGVQVWAVPLGSGETLLKSRNNPDGVAVFGPGSDRTVKIDYADPLKLQPLFSDSTEFVYTPAETAPGTRPLRGRTARLDSSLLFSVEEKGLSGRESVDFRDMVRINLFSDLEVTAVLTRIDHTNSALTWCGNIDGNPGNGMASFTQADGVIIGSINLHEKGMFTVSRQKDGQFEIRERDASAAKFLPPIIPDQTMYRETVSDPGVSYASDGIIELMIVWTIDAAQGAQAQGSSIQAEIANAVSLINTTYANSNVTQRALLVESVGTNYTASDDSLTDLTRLQSSVDGYMDEVHILRQAEKADCVSLITNGWEGNIIGQGYALEYGNRTFFSNYAFNVVDRHYFYYQTLTHELGHNMGAGHELDNPSSPGPQYYSYSSGYHYEASPTDHWHTMMSYSHEGSYKIAHFSNPDVNYGGNPTGLPGDDGTDNARTLNNTMQIVDSFGEDLLPDLTACNLSGQSGFSPESVSSGEELDISIRVCNYGDGPATGFKINFYASENPSISQNDFYLGQLTSSGIASSATSSFFWTGLVPEEIPNGDYYVGWILDADNEVEESDESDNDGLFWSPLLSITQQMECTYSLSPQNQAYGSSGGSSSFNVTTLSGCPWTAVSQATWITITYGASGIGNGSVVYSVKPNNSYLPRSGRIKVEDQYFSVSQDGLIPDCTVTLLPESRTHDNEGGYGSVSVSTPPGCSWEAASQDEWITILSGHSGTGDGLIQYQVEQNLNKENRAGTILVEDAAFSVLQDSPYTELEQRDMIVFPASFRELDPVFSNSWVGATALNLDREEKAMSFSGRDYDGSLLGVNDGFPHLQSKGQLARMTTEIFDQAHQLATITGTGTNTGLPLRGITILGDDQTRRLDGIGHRWIPGRELYLLNGWEEDGQAAVVYLYNFSDNTESETVLQLKGLDGSVVDSASCQIPAGGTLFKKLSDLFTVNSYSGRGYIKITSSSEICGFIMTGSDQSFVAFPAMDPVDTTALYAPHFILLPDGSGTEVQLVNVGLIPVSVVFQIFEDLGIEQETAEITLQPGEMLNGNLIDFVSLDPGILEEDEVMTGKMRVLISTVGEHEGFESPKIIGGVVLSGGENSSAGLPLETAGNSVTVFPHVAQSLDMRIYTGLSVWNVSDDPAEVIVRAWDGDGEVIAVKSFSLEPNQRRVGMLDESFFFGPEFTQVGGHLEVSSDQSLISFCLYGDLDLEYLSTIGGQGVTVD